MFKHLCCCAALFLCSAAQADEISDRICPILEKVQAGMAQKADYAVQAELLMEIGGAYDFDGEKLRTVTSIIDVTTTEGCAAARTAILNHLSMQSLEQALR